MRVLEPKKHRSNKEHTTRSRSKGNNMWKILGVLIFGVSLIVGFQILNTDVTQAPVTNEAIIAQNNYPEQPKKGVMKSYTSQQFADLYKNFAYPNTQRIDENTPITGNVGADQKIRSLAVSRGYEVRSAPVTNTFVTVAPNMLIQERASQPTIDIVAKAKSEGQLLNIIAAYRSAEDQKQIFLDRLTARGIPIGSIATGTYDKQINEVLKTTAVPGYSRHHTGYTIDIACENDPSVIFEKSTCYKWLSTDNFKMAKSYGWIPGYPPGITNQGPDPEPWEFVWVGADSLTE